MDAITALTNLQSAAARSAIKGLVVSLCTLIAAVLGKQISPDALNKAIDQGFLFLPLLMTAYYHVKTLVHSQNAKQEALNVAANGAVAPINGKVYPAVTTPAKP